MARIVTWNIGGAKYLALPAAAREQYARQLTDSLRDLTQQHAPDFVLLQEIVEYGDVHQPTDPLAPPPGYYCSTAIAVDTVHQSNPAKWQQYFEQGGWKESSYLAQGVGILWRKDIAHAAVWDFARRYDADIASEVVRLDTGLFTGNRDTEPRLAVVTHFILEGFAKPVDVFIVNLHLTTLRGEREGLPKIDQSGSLIRQGQLEIVINGIVSRYNEWAAAQNVADRAPPIWILAGDFNSTPESAEIRHLKDMNFIDLNPNKGSGTKSKGMPIEAATITLDYIFAGPAYFALDPYIVNQEIQANPPPLDRFRVSDHLPVLAEIPIVLNP